MPPPPTPQFNIAYSNARSVLKIISGMGEGWGVGYFTIHLDIVKL